MAVTLSVVTPTVEIAGRPRTLQRALDSITGQLENGDEHIVIADGPMLWDWAAYLCRQYARVLYLATPADHCWGNPQRDIGIRVARGDYLLFMDDDNIIRPGMLAVVREAIAQRPGALFLFRTEYNGYPTLPDGTVLWSEQEIRMGNVDGGQIVCPRRPDLLPWVTPGKDVYEADYHFIRNAADVIGEVVWRNEILTTARPKS